MLGEPIAAVRRNGAPYAVIDGCPHRGAPLSRARYEFPGTPTLTCGFHGWTFDVTNGNCVAALPDGPDSPVVGKLRLQTFPLEERNGIVYVWMGSGAPVPLEDDVPRIPLREDATVYYRKSVVHGDWRDHGEFAGGGHFNVLHRDAPAMKLDRFFAYLPNPEAVLTDEEGDGDGEFLLERNEPPVLQADYPGLGTWPPLPLWRRLKRAKRFRPVQGVGSLTALKLPGVLPTQLSAAGRGLLRVVRGARRRPLHVLPDQRPLPPQPAVQAVDRVVVPVMGTPDVHRPLQPPGRADGGGDTRVGGTQGAWRAIAAVPA
jgi:nitrite reductase/ring-hydroxylating ferredoxin subunit